MNYPMVLLNVLGLFAIAGAIVCWFSTLVAINHRGMKSATRLPLFIALVFAARQALSDTGSIAGALLLFVGVFFASSMAIVYLYGWAKRRAFEEDEMAEGSGRYAPVLYVWTGCALYLVLVGFVNLTITGMAAPVHVAGY